MIDFKKLIQKEVIDALTSLDNSNFYDNHYIDYTYYSKESKKMIDNKKLLDIIKDNKNFRLITISNALSGSIDKAFVCKDNTFQKLDAINKNYFDNNLSVDFMIHFIDLEVLDECLKNNGFFYDELKEAQIKYNYNQLNNTLNNKNAQTKKQIKI